MHAVIKYVPTVLCYEDNVVIAVIYAVSLFMIVHTDLLYSEKRIMEASYPRVGKPGVFRWWYKLLKKIEYMRGKITTNIVPYDS